jgi:hypothetical protein
MIRWRTALSSLFLVNMIRLDNYTLFAKQESLYDGQLLTKQATESPGLDMKRWCHTFGTISKGSTNVMFFNSAACEFVEDTFIVKSPKPSSGFTNRALQLSYLLSSNLGEQFNPLSDFLFLCSNIGACLNPSRVIALFTSNL